MNMPSSLLWNHYEARLSKGDGNQYSLPVMLQHAERSKISAALTRGHKGVAVMSNDALFEKFEMAEKSPPEGRAAPADRAS
jgi:hypothetical protein